MAYSSQTYLVDELTKVKALLALVEEENKRLHSYICLHTIPDTSRPALPFRIPFAGEGECFSPDSVLSHCYGALLPMFDMREARVLRQVCKEFKSTVADFPWEDEKTVIKGSVAAWKACFPRARWANVFGYAISGGRRTPVVDADFVHFVGLRKLDMSGCRSITDAAFEHLKGIHTLDMSGCSQPTITDAAFVHLKGVHTLDLGYCNQATITDAAFVHLKGIHTLDMSGCRQTTITDAALVHLKGIHSLSLYYCPQLTSAVFTHLRGVKRLNIGFCPQLTLTDDSLEGIEWLNVFHTSQALRDAVENAGYPFVEINAIGFGL